MSPGWEDDDDATRYDCYNRRHAAEVPDAAPQEEVRRILVGVCTADGPDVRH